MVVGGDRVHYPGNAGTSTTHLLTIKILINSIISTAGTKIMRMYIKDFYLNTPMARYKYMRLRIADMPDDVIKHYNLRNKATPDGYIYCEIQKGMYGPPQAGIIAQQLLKECLQKHGYQQSQTTPGLWKHDTRPISFSLVINSFGVKYVGKENAQHLLDTVRHYYKCSCNWKGERYCGLSLKMRLQGQESCLNAWVCCQSPHLFSASPTHQEIGSTIPTCQAKLWGKDAACHGRGHNPPPQQGGGKIYPRSVRSFPFPCTRS